MLAGQVWDDVAVVPTMRVGENVAEPRPSATPWTLLNASLRS